MHFGYQFTREDLEEDAGVRVVQCDRAAIPEELATADVVVPLMSRLDAKVRTTACPERRSVGFFLPCSGCQVHAPVAAGDSTGVLLASLASRCSCCAPPSVSSSSSSMAWALRA